MDQTTAGNSRVERFWSTVQRSSAFIIMGSIFSIPGLLAVYLVKPQAVGFFLIGATGMIAHVVLRSLDPERISDVDIEFSELARVEALVYIGLMFLSIIIGVSVKLWAAAGLGYLLAVGNSGSVIGIGIALAFPIADRKLTSIRWYLSISGIAIVGVIYLIAYVLSTINVVNHVSGETLTESSRRFSI